MGPFSWGYGTSSECAKQQQPSFSYPCPQAPPSFSMLHTEIQQCFCSKFRGITGSTWGIYNYYVNVFHSITVSIRLLQPLGSIIQSEASTHNPCYLECLDVQCSRILARWSEDTPGLMITFSNRIISALILNLSVQSPDIVPVQTVV